MKTHNPNCDGSHCVHEAGEVRLLPLGTKPEHGNLIVCKACYSHELGWRADRNEEMERTIHDLPNWEDLEVYKQ